MTFQNTKAAAFDAAKAEAFADQMGNVLNSGAIAIMLSIGHRTGLFDTMAKLPPASSTRIAEAAALDERYVREWLAAMVTGGIVAYDAKAGTYHLPSDHAACLTRNAPLGNIAVYTQFIAMAGAAQDTLLQCFETGEGTSYGDYPCFHQVMAEDSAQTVVAQLFESILPLAEGIAERLETGIDVLDAGCGSGQALIAMAGRYPESRFTGYDLCGDAVANARRIAGAAGVSNVAFEKRDLTDFDESERYDLITSFDAVHDQKHPGRFLANLHHALKPGGIHLMQDIGGSAHLENNLEFPLAAFLYTVSCLHCMPVSLGQGGDGLGTMWGWETAEAMLSAAGFQSTQRHVLEHDPMNVWFVSRKGQYNV
jgi:2-polyprenyl-3-methyl-5-hydroxy-6-metoxy-1,4-benzoquinol methylase